MANSGGDARETVHDVGRRIRAVRERAKMSQKDFAETIGASRSYLSEVENEKGKPSIEMLVGIAKAFPNVRAHWLLTGFGLQTEEEHQNEAQPVAKIDKAGLRVALGCMESVVEDIEPAPSVDSRAIFLAMLYDTYVAHYTSRRKEEDERDARRWAAHYCAIASENFDSRFLVAYGAPSVPLSPEGDDPDESTSS